MNRPGIYRFILLPFALIGMFFVTGFLYACACNPLPGSQVTVQLVDSNQNPQKNIVALPLFNELGRQISNFAFKAQGKTDPAFLKQAQTEKIAEATEFQKDFRSTRDNKITKIQFIIGQTTVVGTKNYPDFVVVKAPGKATERRVDLEVSGVLEVANQLKWNLKFKVTNVIFKIPQSKLPNRLANAVSLGSKQHPAKLKNPEITNLLLPPNNV